MSLELTGNIIHIGETETVGSAGTFKKRVLVIETEEQYKQQIPIDFVQDKTSVLDSYSIGDNVTVGINIRGNQYNGKWFSSINGWRIEKKDQTVFQEAKQAKKKEENPFDDIEDSEPNLPF